MQGSTIKHLCRATLLILALLFMVIWILWLNNSAIITRVSQSAVFHYEAAAKAQLADTMQRLKQDPAQHIGELEKLLFEWQTIARRDRLHYIKRQIYEELVKNYRELGMYHKAHEWTKHWMAFDKYDLHARASDALTFYYEPEFRQKGKLLIKELYEQFPRHKLIKDRYLDILHNENDPVTAIKLIQQDTAFKTAWRLYADMGRGLNENDAMPVELKPVLSTTEQWQFVTPYVSKLQLLRFDLPPHEELIISDITLTFMSKQGDVIFTPDMSEFLLHDMTQNGNSLQSKKRPDAYFSWKLPKTLQQQKLALKFNANIHVKYPDWILQWLNNSGDIFIRDRLTRAGIKNINHIIKMRNQQ